MHYSMSHKSRQNHMISDKKVTFEILFSNCVIISCQEFDIRKHERDLKSYYD